MKEHTLSMGNSKIETVDMYYLIELFRFLIHQQNQTMQNFQSYAVLSKNWKVYFIFS